MIIKKKITKTRVWLIEDFWQLNVQLKKIFWDMNWCRYLMSNLINILHGFKGEKLEYLPQGGKKAL